MNPGKLRRRITIQVMDETATNEMGEVIRDFVDWKTVWANVQFSKHNFYKEEDKMKDNLWFYDFAIRYIPDLKPDMRISYKGRFFEIQSINNLDELNREIHIFAYEKGLSG